MAKITELEEYIRVKDKWLCSFYQNLKTQNNNVIHVMEKIDEIHSDANKFILDKL